MEFFAIQWLQDIPPVTRAYVVCSTGLSVAEYFGYVEVSDFILNPNNSLNLKQVFLNTLYNGPISMNFCTKLYLFSRYSNWVEVFINSPKNYLWMILILITSINLYSKYIINLSLIGPVLKETILYIWSRNHADDEIFFTLISLRACWIPWVTYFITIALNTRRDPNQWKSALSSIIIGHLYWFLNDELPKLHGSKSFLRPVWEWNYIQQISNIISRIKEYYLFKHNDPPRIQHLREQRD
ncbi:hypothetical protein C6P40_000519 [Pichia californica]|uniref:Derlin n=1 Tax=Pichia californica TaxID=460514 RepID=A0A9P7BGX0_9ASCO|nr:hypothetical protein C6P42_001425 [[Candida] californica]KAG0688788.1 hypothetical protein C6P40_000519 [[Candida] californica]